jgi:hypothetical protein
LPSFSLLPLSPLPSLASLASFAHHRILIGVLTAFCCN